MRRNPQFLHFVCLTKMLPLAPIFCHSYHFTVKPK